RLIMLSISLPNSVKKWTLKWASPIRESLSQPPKRLIQGATETTELSGSNTRILWILSRSFLRQRVFELADGLPESKRKSALNLLVRKWSPYPVTGFQAQWVGRRASVYAWDAGKVNAAIVASGFHPSRCTVWPETFMRSPIEDGARIVTM